MLLNSLVGLCSLFLFYGLNKAWRGLANCVQRALVDTYTRLAGIVFCLASISGYQNVGAATTIAVLVAAS